MPIRRMSVIGGKADIARTFAALQKFCLLLDDIPRSRHNPKILWIDDAEIVGDRIT
jgi:hypothetical protein